MKYLITTIAAVVLVGCGPSISIHEAVQDGNIEVVKQHLAAGTDVNGTDVHAMNPDGWTPLQLAAYEAYRDYAEKNVIIKLLIAQGADVNAKTEGGDTPLHFAASMGHKEIAELLIANGADVNAKSQHEHTPLHFAARTGEKEVAGLLIDKGADVNAASRNGKTPLDLVTEIKYFDTKFADLVRQHGGKTSEELKAEGK